MIGGGINNNQIRKVEPPDRGKQNTEITDQTAGNERNTMHASRDAIVTCEGRRFFQSANSSPTDKYAEGKGT